MIDLVKIGFIIAAIIVLIRLKVPLSITLIASSISFFSRSGDRR